MADDAGLAPPDHTYRGEGSIPGDARIVAIHPSVEEIPDELFMDCHRLEVVQFHNDGGLLRIGKRAFFCCSSLQRFGCPSTVVEISAWAFTGCSSLTYFKLPEGLVSIEARTFAACNSLKDLRIPPSVTRIGYTAFSGCVRLTSMGLPRGLRRIENSAFPNCLNLGSVSIPPSVEYVGDYAFAECCNLALVRLHEDLRTLGRSAFQGCLAVTFRFVRLSERREAIALDKCAASEVEGRLNEASDALVGGSPNAWEECRESLRRAHAILTHQLEEVTTTLELALWKKKISEEERQGPRPLRHEYRVNCGANMNIAIREVLGFIPPPWP